MFTIHRNPQITTRTEEWCPIVDAVEYAEAMLPGWGWAMMRQWHRAGRLPLRGDWRGKFEQPIGRGWLDHLAFPDPPRRDESTFHLPDGSLGMRLPPGLVFNVDNNNLHIDQQSAVGMGFEDAPRVIANVQVRVDVLRRLVGNEPNPTPSSASGHQTNKVTRPKKYQTTGSAFTQVRQQATAVKTYTADEIAKGAKTGQWDALNKQNGAVLKSAAGVAAPETTSAKSSNTTGNPAPSNDVMPGSRLLTVDLGPMRIARPENWDVIAAQQQGQSITIAPRSGIVSNGIGYGVVINGASFKGKATIDEMTAEIVRSLQSGGDLQVVGKATPIEVAGVGGRSVTMQSTSPFPDARGQSQKERDWLVTLPRPDGSAIFLVFVAPESEYERLSPTFDRMLKSAQF